MASFHSQEWTTAGTYSWTVPLGVTMCWVNVMAGGGGGHASYPGSAFAGEGGGAGELISNLVVPVTPLDSITVVVGAGGSKGYFTTRTPPAGSTLPGGGGDSKFGSYIALGAGWGETGGLPLTGSPVAGYGGGVNGGLRGNHVFPLDADLFPSADATKWFGGAGGGAGGDETVSPGGDGQEGGPAGGYLRGGAGGVWQTPLGEAPGGGGAASVFGKGAQGAIEEQDAADATATGSGGGGGGRTAIGTSAFGSAGKSGYVAVIWLE